MSRLSRLTAEPLRLINFHLACCSSQRYLSTSIPRSLDKKAYSHTLRLPKTNVPLKHKNPVAVEESLRASLSDELYRWQRDRPGPPFRFLDGPPYANGNLHMGHALNKVLKDFINRYKVLRGHQVHFEPGWDCHGLPIEQKALASAKISHVKAEPTKIRNIARKTALKAIEVQKKELRNLGVMADWDNQKATYRTLDRDYQVRQLRLFKQMVDLGHITHRLKPTYYSPKSRTALAEAELKYMDDHESQSVYVSFDVQPADMTSALRRVWDGVKGDQASLKLGIWTTTPWTLVSNLGVAVRNDLRYAVVRVASGQLLLLQQDRVDPMREILGEIESLAELAGSDLVGTRYTHLFHPASSSRARPAIMHASHVTTESGTGLVHMAPVHGHEDYAAFLAAGSSPDEMYCAVDDDGRFISTLSDHLDVEAPILEKIVGQEVLGDGAKAVIDLLQQNGTLLAQQRIKHRYPYDWKSKTPVIIRATPQWFADVEAIKDRAAAAIDEIRFYPSTGRQRLNAFVSSRAEWCISRQRSWGVPIPVLFNAKDEPVVDPAFLDHAINVLEEKGIEHWWDGSVTDFIPPNAETPGSAGLKKGGDTLDVWFDSGSAWTSIPELAPADVILEGSDQHRGWFQSTLLTRLMTTNDTTPAAKKIITHGFITDGSGQKMSKSDGNGISPMDIIHGGKGKPALGADVLRTWVASVDYSKDVSLGPSAITHASEQLRKIRSVLRFALGNIAEAPSQTPQLGILDRHVLHELQQLERIVAESYDQFAFSKALQHVSAFASSTLSASYYDVNKDVLYCDDVGSPRRQAVLYTLKQVLASVIRLIAPILPHLAEELNQALPDPFTPTVFAAGWPVTESAGYAEIEQAVSDLLEVRAQLGGLVASCRDEKLLKTSAEVDVHIEGSGRVMDHLRAYEHELDKLLGCAASAALGSISGLEPQSWHRTLRAEIGESSLNITVSPTACHQCPRCWLYQADEAEHLCQRCEVAVGSLA